MELYRNYYTFVSWSEGNNFNALNHWVEGFSPELDFPRLAAARIESRFLSATPFPDDEYGAFFETLIRTASDARWTGAVKEENFWLLRRAVSQESGNFEFFILVTISKSAFALQLEDVFRNVRPNPPPTRDQVNAANRVRSRFYEGF